MATIYQLGFVRNAGWVIATLSASRPQGTWESAMNGVWFGAHIGGERRGELGLVK
jgi:hypothetical protein